MTAEINSLHMIQAISELAPEVAAKCDGNTYASVTWADPTAIVPDEATLMAKAQWYADEEPKNELRKVRNRALARTDWTQTVDAPLTDEQKAEWRTYRTALRNITDTYSSLDTVVWPTYPGG
jgi:hypothetical protein|tara:strand:- start:344 stop:709 length:366 start_codon:yes stop_codon:yes gene_type:complete